MTKNKNPDKQASLLDALNDLKKCAEILYGSKEIEPIDADQSFEEEDDD